MMKLTHFIQYAVAAAAVFTGYFLGIFIVFHLTNANYESTFYVLLFAAIFLGLSLCFEPFELLMIHSFKSFKLNKNHLFFLAGCVQVLFLWMTVYTADEFIKGIWLSTTEEFIIAGVFFAFDACFYKKKAFA